MWQFVFVGIVLAGAFVGAYLAVRYNRRKNL